MTQFYFSKTVLKKAQYIVATHCRWLHRKNGQLAWHSFGPWNMSSKCLNGNLLAKKHPPGRTGGLITAAIFVFILGLILVAGTFVASKKLAIDSHTPKWRNRRGRGGALVQRSREASDHVFALVGPNRDVANRFDVHCS